MLRAWHILSQNRLVCPQPCIPTSAYRRVLGQQLASASLDGVCKVTSLSTHIVSPSNQIAMCCLVSFWQIQDTSLTDPIPKSVSMSLRTALRPYGLPTKGPGLPTVGRQLASASLDGVCKVMSLPTHLQGYLAHKKHPPPRTLQ